MSLASAASNLSPRDHRFKSFHDLLTHLEAKKMVNKILIANNGLAAVKGINSIRQWCFSHLDIELAKNCVEFEAMATPEDLSVDAEFCHLAEHYVEVPGAGNRNNYANVDLIVQTAIQQRCDAVYPGWGHASENPALPRDLLKKTGGRVTFCGPGETAMFSLGDKIASTIIAQSFGVSCVDWSGSHVRIPSGSPPGVVPPALHDQAFVHTLEECIVVCERIGYPVMLKASEGGGGKGIRRVTCLADVAGCYSAVKDEVVGCHIFVMRMLSNVRHLEVQLLADSYGDCIAVRTRDCSVQRRHQKIIEEGPVVGVDPNTVEEMEQAAVRMAKAVGYLGLGTVEFMYDRDTGKYCFLELNPRVQVEHPVSELISGVNLPAALLLVSLGIPLHRIPEVRKFFGEEDKYGTSKIDFNTRKSLPPRGHAIAVRITAEDAEEGFRPTTGAIEEISFKDSVDCWGYFSVGHGRGGIHQYADSQFGHIFAHSATREEARRAMIIALSSLVVRGEIRYSTPFVVGLLERQEFIESKVYTAWLDGILAGSMVRPSERFIFQALAAGAVFRLIRQNSRNEQDYLKALSAGHTPATNLLDAHRTDTFIVESKKYTIHSGMVSPSIVALVLNGSVLHVTFRELQSSGAMQLQLGNRNVVVSVEEEAIGCRVNFTNRTIVLTADADPTKLRASVSGKLVRYLVRNGDHVNSGSPYCEIEVMKMIYPLICNVTGTVTLRAAPGATLQAGKLLAEINPDDPSAVARAEADLTSTWPTFLISSGHERVSSANLIASGSENENEKNKLVTAVEEKEKQQQQLQTTTEEDVMVASADSASRARSGVKMLHTLLEGYHPSGIAGKYSALSTRVAQCLDDLSSLGIYSVTLSSLALPFMNFDEESSSQSSSATSSTTSPQKNDEFTNIGKSTSPIQKLLYVLQLLLHNFLEIEKLYDGQSRASALENLRKIHSGEENLKRVFEIDFIHHQKHRVEVAKKLLHVLGEDRVLLVKSIDLLKEITTLHSASTSSFVLQARFLLRNAQGPTFEERKNQLRDSLEQGQALAKTTTVSMELACAVLFDATTPNTLPAMLEFILRRAYYGEADIINYDVFRSGNDWRFKFNLSAKEYNTDLIQGGSPTNAAAAANVAASSTSSNANAFFPGFSVSPIHKVRLADAGFGVVIPEDRNLEASLKKFGDSAANSLSQIITNSFDRTVYGIVFVRCRSDANIQDLSEEYRQAINSVDSFHRISSDAFVFYLTVIAWGASNGPYFFTYSRQQKTMNSPTSPTPTSSASASASAAAIATPVPTPREIAEKKIKEQEPIGASTHTPPSSPTPDVADSPNNKMSNDNNVNNNNNDMSATSYEFMEDKMLRNVFAPTAGRLETRRLEKHYNVNIIPQFGNRKIHLYVATPKSKTDTATSTSNAKQTTTTEQQKSSAATTTTTTNKPATRQVSSRNDNRRLFVRCFFSPADLMLQPWDSLTDIEAGQVMSNVISAVELAFADSSFVLTKLNHLFVNLVEISLDLATLPALIHKLSTSFGNIMKRLRFAEVEISFRVPVFENPSDKKSSQLLGTVPCRIFANNITGYAVSIAMFAEVVRNDGHTELHPLHTPDDIEKYIRHGEEDVNLDNDNQQQATGKQDNVSDNNSGKEIHVETWNPEEGGKNNNNNNNKTSPMSPTAGMSETQVSVDHHAEANPYGWGTTTGFGDRLPSAGSLEQLDAAAALMTEVNSNNTNSTQRKSSSFLLSNNSVRTQLQQSLNRARLGVINVNASDLFLNASEAYPPLSTTQLKRLQAQSTGTTYVYDWLILLEVAAKRSWKRFRKARGCCSPEAESQGVPQVPEHCVSSKQLVLPSTLSEEQLAQQQENPSSFGTVMEVPAETKQTCGMVAWKCNILLPSRYCASSKEATKPTTVVIIANDITWENGAFSIIEDRLFAAVSVYARENKYPFIYLSSNSGARIGLATDVQQRFKAALKHQKNQSDASLDYLYLTKKDLDELEKAGVRVVTEKIEVTEKSNNKEIRYKIIDVIGSSKDPIGVENLQGSALLAGQMSLNYATIPTISIVSGRSVGIGAYLNRLGRRVIQVQGSPIILTGFQAINRLLGKEVYSSQDQLGGNDIMQPNGVSHWGPNDDLAGVGCALRWLYVVGASFENFSKDALSTMSSTTSVQRNFFSAPHICQRFHDPWDRDVTFAPQVATPYDPRLLIDVGEGTLGIFDKGSFQESLTRWASTVVVGRATLGGIPLGVIAVETRTMTKLDPADPADLESRSTSLKQAGQVWFPDSSRKTADALEDFRNEGLPCFVIANWRGFSGGMRDMFDEVLKFGASIVDNLRVYDQPVIIYIPPFGELRGGSWVVLDPVINHNGCVEMFADPLSRGGILEPAGIVNVKFKDSDVRHLWRRSREQQVRDDLSATATSGENVAESGTATSSKTSSSVTTPTHTEQQQQLEARLRKVEESEHALFTDIAVTFADLHDTPGRMYAVKCISDVVPLKDARRYFYWKLRRQMIETSIARSLKKHNLAKEMCEALEMTRKIVSSSCVNKSVKHVDPSASASSSSSASNCLQQMKKEMNLVEVLESSECFETIHKKCTENQVHALLDSLKSLRGGSGSSASSNSKNFEQIEALLAATFKH